MGMEMISLVGGGIFGAFLKLWSQASQDRQERFLASMQINKMNLEAIKNAREYQDSGFSWTRRIIAVSCIFTIVILPKILVAFFPDIGIWVSSEILEDGFLFFSEDKTITQWNHLRGFVITPVDTMIVSAVIGVYFGASVVKR
jgi:hypothetical protein